MASGSDEETISCKLCGEEFDRREQLNEHMKDGHDSTGEETRGESEDAAAASGDASASTGSMTVETNESPSAAEPGEATGPGQDDEVRPEPGDNDEN
jgi:hypothetical protein